MNQVQAQVKLLQVLQECSVLRVGGVKVKPVDVRIIAATNRDLEEGVRQGCFREDLFYRLNVVTIRVPPLRQRPEDLELLIKYFLEVFNTLYQTKKEIDKEAMQLLKNYRWPGNVRELENMIERLVVISDEKIVRPAQLPPSIPGAHSTDVKIFVREICPLKEALETMEKQLLQKAFQQYGSTYKMAEVLQINQSTVIRKLNKYRIGKPGRKKG